MSKKDCKVIYRRYIRRGGKVLDAHDYGYKAWPISLCGSKRRPKRK